MIVTGKTVEGQRVLPLEIVLHKGAMVKVETIDSIEQKDSLVKAVEKLAKPRPHLSKDYDFNNGHYVGSELKKRTRST